MRFGDRRFLHGIGCAESRGFCSLKVLWVVVFQEACVMF